MSVGMCMCCVRVRQVMEDADDDDVVEKRLKQRETDVKQGATSPSANRSVPERLGSLMTKAQAYFDELVEGGACTCTSNMACWFHMHVLVSIDHVVCIPDTPAPPVLPSSLPLICTSCCHMLPSSRTSGVGKASVHREMDRHSCWPNRRRIRRVCVRYLRRSCMSSV